MSEEKTMILDMLAAGKVTVDEAERLIRALCGLAIVKPEKPVLPDGFVCSGWGPWMDHANELIFRNQLPSR